MNITQEQAALLFGGGIHGFSKYERGEVIQSTSMDRLLRIALELPDAFSMLSHLSYGQKTEIKRVRNIIKDKKVKMPEFSLSYSNVISIDFRNVEKKREFTIDLNDTVDCH